MRNSGRVLTAALAAGLLVLAGCGGGDSGSSKGSGPGGISVPKIDKLASLGAGEGQANTTRWAGYVEDGDDDPEVDSVHAFEREARCKVDTKGAATPDQM